MTDAHKRLKPIPYAPCVPLLGSLPFLGQHPAKTITEWYRKRNLGSIFRVKFGHLDAIVLNDYASIRECFVGRSDCFSGRGDQISRVIELWKGDGLLFLDYGDKWVSQSKFCIQIFERILKIDKFQQMAFDKSREMVQALKMQLRGEGIAEGYASGNYRSVTLNCKENKCKCTLVEAECDWKCLDPNNFAHQGSANLICRILFGRSFYGDEKEYCDVLTETPIQARKSFAAFMTTFLMPFLKHVPPIRGIINEALKLRLATFKMIREIVDDHDAHFKGVDGHSDFIDLFLDRIVNKQGKDDDEFFTHTQLHGLLFDIFTFASQMPATTLIWILLYVAKHPDLQNELRCEIETYFSNSDMEPSSNLTKLYLTRATIHEVIRLRPINTLGFPRKVSKDCEVSGYKFTKDSIVMPNLWSVHHDENEFPNPEEFNPKRYINDSGEFSPNTHVIGFSVGGRQCPGKAIAEFDLLCTLVQVIRNFEFRLPKVWDSSSESYETATFDFCGINGQVLLPPEYWLQWRVISETV